METPRFGESTRDWFAVQVWAGREPLCARHLELRGYDVFLPLYHEKRRWSDRLKTVDCALFPGYVFCRSNGGDVGKIIAAPSVIRIVGNSRGPVAIPSDEVAAIQRIVQARLSAEPCEFLQQGDQVHIELGPLRGTHGVVVMIKKHHRLVVSIPLLQRSVTVEIESDWLSIPWDARSSLNRSATPSGE